MANRRDYTINSDSIKDIDFYFQKGNPQEFKRLILLYSQGQNKINDLFKEALGTLFDYMTCLFENYKLDKFVVKLNNGKNITVDFFDYLYYGVKVDKKYLSLFVSVLDFISQHDAINAVIYNEMTDKEEVYVKDKGGR